ITAWVALFFMWIGAGATDFLVDRKADEAKAASERAKRESELAAKSMPQLAKSGDPVQSN
ncbi:MAG: YeeE/YedE family protein, partial [Gammaproteobacteria bacterium]|nr:YeeE/YedE family protein [Gammaproteobacteria bacterium]